MYTAKYGNKVSLLTKNQFFYYLDLHDFHELRIVADGDMQLKTVLEQLRIELLELAHGDVHLDRVCIVAGGAVADEFVHCDCFHILILPQLESQYTGKSVILFQR